MSVPCETLLKNFLPAVRSLVAKELSLEYKLNQNEIAKKLGLTQAAISKYLSGNYSDETKNLEKNSKLKKISEGVIKQIVSNKENFSVCDVCEGFSGKDCFVRLVSSEILDRFAKSK